MITKQLINSLQSENMIATAAVQCSGTFKQYDNGYSCLEVADNFAYIAESTLHPFGFTVNPSVAEGRAPGSHISIQTRKELKKLRKNKTAQIAARWTGIGETINHSNSFCFNNEYSLDIDFEIEGGSFHLHQSKKDDSLKIVCCLDLSSDTIRMIRQELGLRSNDREYDMHLTVCELIL